MATESMSMHPDIAQVRARYDGAAEASQLHARTISSTVVTGVVAVVLGLGALSLSMNRSH